MMPDGTASRWQPFQSLSGLTRSPACYVAMGDPAAPKLLFLHGFGGDQLTWHNSLVAFASRFRTVSVDLPGHGRSTLDVGTGSLAEMTDWLIEFLAAAGIGPTRIVGHSMGCKIALNLALVRPDLVVSLSLISPAGLGGFFDRDLLDRFLDADDPAIAAEIAARLVGPGSAPLIPNLARAIQSAASRPGQKAALSRLLDHSGAIGSPLAEASVPWSRIACPIQVIWGAEDRVLPMPEPWRLPPAAPVDVLPGIGHLPQIEAPREVSALLNRFLR
jgi:pyruvate dehydrogenase E2 component (dihydrolipoamide acetyltransferase)